MLAVGSLFSGVEGFGLGFEAAGFEVRWQCEIDKDATSVLERHYPNVKRYRDVRDVDPSVLEPVDVVTFGSPCQDLSVAGKRAGLEGGRSGLFYEAVRIIRGVRPAFALWENVPGAFSSNDGRDFGAVLAALAECGALDISWRVLDAQWFGVPQRRRRIFLVADFGGERAVSVLFESEGVRGDSASSGTARQGSAGNAQNGAGSGSVAFTLAASNRHTGDGHGNAWNTTYVPIRGYAENFNGIYEQSVAPSITCEGLRPSQNAGGFFVPVSGEAVRDRLTAHGRRIDAESETFVVGCDVADTLSVGANQTTGVVGDVVAHYACWDEAQITSAANRSSVEYGMPAPTLNGSGLASVIGFKWQSAATGGLSLDTTSPSLGTTQTPAVTQHGAAHDRTAAQAEASAREILRTLRELVGEEAILQWAARGSWSVQAQEVLQSELHGESVRRSPSDGPRMDGGAPSCETSGRPEDALRGVSSGEESGCSSQGSELPEQLARELDRALSQLSSPRAPQASSMSVRRLTPREAERLMGYPDDHTRWRGDGSEIPDGPRYRMCGNGVAAPVAAWIAHRMRAALEAS